MLGFLPPFAWESFGRIGGWVKFRIFVCINELSQVLHFLLHQHFSTYRMETTTIEELRSIVAQSILSTEAFKAQMAASQEAADRRAVEAKAEADRRAVEADRRAVEAAEDSRNLKRRIDEIGKQLGGLGNKFGSFTEGLLLPSVETILRTQFGVTDFYMRLKTQNGEDVQELDGFGFVNGAKNIGFIIEVKSHLDKRGIEQALEQVRHFGAFHPQYQGMTLYGIIAAVDTVSAAQRNAVFNAGLYLVTVHDDVASMAALPQDFTPFSSIA